ncbi:histidine kinase [Clostridium minihomine]|uniref:histidine kinase n=1 Tax=Clostridium minihomine TaxID=2045012 RepID=UPI000C784F07|nr:histidine kinase [Clostridium minihomine]
MDIKLEQGDFAVGQNGLPFSVSTKEELLQRAKIRLSVPKGSFSYDSQLGSRLHTLKLSGSDLNARARELTEEALAKMTELSVEKVRCDLVDQNHALLKVELVTPYGLGSISLKLENKGE